MLITRRELRRLIHESLLLEITPGIIDPGSGGADISATRQAKMAGKSRYAAEAAIGAEIILGFTPVGIAIDIKDLIVGLRERDPTMIAMAGIGFIPGLGDAIKAPYKAIRAGRATSGQVRRAQEVTNALADNLGPSGLQKLKNKIPDTQFEVPDPSMVRGGSGTLRGARNLLDIFPTTWKDASGRKFVAVKNPSGGAHVYYTSSGTGSKAGEIGGSKAGEWVSMYGFSVSLPAGKVPNTWFVKNLSRGQKRGVAGSWQNNVEIALDSTVPGGRGISKLKPSSGGQISSNMLNVNLDRAMRAGDIEDVENTLKSLSKFNKWYKSIGGAYLPDRHLPGINISVEDMISVLRSHAKQNGLTRSLPGLFFRRK